MSVLRKSLLYRAVFKEHFASIFTIDAVTNSDADPKFH